MLSTVNEAATGYCDADGFFITGGEGLEVRAVCDEPGKYLVDYSKAQFQEPPVVLVTPESRDGTVFAFLGKKTKKRCEIFVRGMERLFWQENISAEIAESTTVEAEGPGKKSIKVKEKESLKVDEEIEGTTYREITKAALNLFIFVPED